MQSVTQRLFLPRRNITNQLHSLLNSLCRLSSPPWLAVWRPPRDHASAESDASADWNLQPWASVCVGSFWSWIRSVQHYTHHLRLFHFVSFHFIIELAFRPDSNCNYIVLNIFYQLNWIFILFYFTTILTKKELFYFLELSFWPNL